MMANDADAERKHLYYSPGGRPLVIEEPSEYLPQNGRYMQDEQEESSEQPLDLSQISPKPEPTVQMTQDQNCNGRHVHRPEQYGRVSPVMNRYLEQSPNGTLERQSSSVRAVSLSPAMVQPVVAVSQSPVVVRPVISPNGQDQQNAVAPRPFKAYIQNQLPGSLASYNLPVPPNVNGNGSLISGLLPGFHNDEYIEFRNKMIEHRYASGRRINSLLNARPVSAPKVPVVKDIGASQSAPKEENKSDNDQRHQSSDSNDSAESSQNQAPVPMNPGPNPAVNNRKRGRSNTDEVKDDSYWERRRKNNEAAKRSRDARRAKEDEVAIRAAFLEQENTHLRLQLALLKGGLSENHIKQYDNMQYHQVIQ